MHRFSMLLLLVLSSLEGLATGKIAGMVKDGKTGEPIIGAAVIVKNTQAGAATDVDGRYLIELPAGTYGLEVRYTGYQPKLVEEVAVTDGQVTSLNILLGEAAKKEIGEVVVRATARRESVSALYNLQKTSVALSSGISADIIQRSPDRNTGEVLKRVSGASVKDNKFVIIRGLSDRYNAAMINNAQMPSTEPDKKAFSFDIIPSNLIDNMIINKTAAPDLPGDFAGGVVQVLTRDVPDQPFLNVGLTLGYNNQATGKDFRSNQQGTDFPGFPGSKYDLPAAFGDDYTDYKRQPRAQRLDAARQLNNNYRVMVYTAMPNTGLQLSFGRSSKVGKEGKFGTVLGLTYRNSFTIIPDLIRNNFEVNNVINNSSRETQFRYSSSLSGIANFAYVYKKSKLTFKNLYNKLYDNAYYEREGFSLSYLQQYQLFSTVPSDRQVFSSQLEGEHAIGAKNVKVVWNLNYANLTADQQDLRTAGYARPTDFINSELRPDESKPYTLNTRNSRRFFSDLRDHTFGGNVSVSYPFELLGQKQTVKAGYLGLYKDRTFDARFFQYKAFDDLQFNPAVGAQAVSYVLAPSNLNETGFELEEITSPTDRYDASSQLHAGYLMLDNNLGDKWRLTWGVRFESYVQNLNFQDLSNTKVRQTDIFNDVLPSLNLSYNHSDRAKFRFSASRTVNRPEFRELAPFQFVDFENNWQMVGNPKLVRGNISNLDARYELYPGAGEAVTIGAFFKHFTNPIEAVMDAQTNLDFFIFGYANAPSATATGLELDLRKTLAFIGDQAWLKNLTVGANFTYIRSRVDATGFGLKQDRPLQGQSPYIINGSVLYHDMATGLAVGAMYNRVGHRIAIVGNATVPTTWENGRDLVDFQISKAILKKKGEIKLTVADILNQPTVLYWNTDGKDSYQAGPSTRGIGNDQIFQSARRGINFNLGFSYKFGK